MKKYLMPYLLLFAFFLSACSKEAPPVTRPVHKVGVDPIDAQLLEQDNFNIPYWLDNGVKGRVLVRLSAIDGLAPVLDEVLDELYRARDKKDINTIITGGEAAPGALYTSDNTVYLADKLGIIDEVYWVVPLFQSITEEDLDGFKQFLIDKLPDQKQDIETMRLTGKVGEGTISGVPVKIVSLEDLPQIGKPVLLDIDVSYLSALYQDEKKTRMLSFISGFFKMLRDKGLSSDMVTVSASNKDGGVPYKFRFLALYLQEMLKDPKVIEGQPPALWSERADAWKAEQVSFKEAIPVYKNILKEYPQDAASHYDLSYAYFMLGDLENCKRELAEAARLKPGYNGAYREYAYKLKDKGNTDKARDFLAAVR